MAESELSDEEFLLDPSEEETPNYFRPKDIPVSDVAPSAIYSLSAEYKFRSVYASDLIVAYTDYIGRTTYPDNHATISASGHKFELDDSVGSERVNLEHRSGTKIEMLPDGALVKRIEGDEFEVIASDKNVMIRGNCNVTIEGNATTHVRGDYTLKVDGAYNLEIAGDATDHIRGNKYSRVEANSETRVVGSLLQEARGNVIERYWSNRTTRVLGKEAIEVGGNYKLTVETTFDVVSWGALTASFHGGTMTLNGDNANGTAGEGILVVQNLYAEDIDAANDVHVGSELHSPLIKSDVTHATTFEGTAKKADYATTAGVAGSGTPIPVVPNPSSPTDPSAAPQYDAEVVDVTTTSRPFIIDLDRSSITEMNVSRLSFEEARRRLYNRALLTNSKFLSDLVATEVISSSISSSAYKIIRSVEYDDPKVQIRINDSVPSWFKSEDASRRTQLSPFFYASHMCPAAVLKDQIGLTKAQIVNNMRMMAMNILEPLKFRFRESWWISAGLYNPYANEKLDTIGAAFAQGLAVAIQFPRQESELYAEVVKNIIEDAIVPYDKMILSYIDYDPSGENEPCIILTLGKRNAREFYTEFNHKKIDDRILVI